MDVASLRDVTQRWLGFTPYQGVTVDPAVAGTGDTSLADLMVVVESDGVAKIMEYICHIITSTYESRGLRSHIFLAIHGRLR
jgi:hypothetical protein